MTKFVSNSTALSGRDALQCVSTEKLQCVSTEKQINTFKNKYRIQSARLQGYDYASNGAYFVTICTKNREHFFGNIVETHCNASLQFQYEMQLSEMGKIVAEEWRKTAEIRKNVELGEWIVMPNHFHAVVILNNENCKKVETHCNASLQKNCNASLQSGCNASLQNNEPYQNTFGPQSQNLSAIIRGFKGATTKQIHISGFSDFAWQPRFHDHIIRNEKEFEKISEYIFHNPQNWQNDNYF